MYRNAPDIWVSFNQLDKIDLTQSLLIDLRSPQSFQTFHLPHFISLPYSQMPSWIDQLDHRKALYFVCDKGTTAYDLALWLNARGFRAYAFQGGMAYYFFLTQNQPQTYF